MRKICTYRNNDKVGEERGQALDKHSGQVQSNSASTNIPLPHFESLMLALKVEQTPVPSLSSCIQTFPRNVRYEWKSGAQSIDYCITALDLGLSAVQLWVAVLRWCDLNLMSISICPNDLATPLEWSLEILRFILELTCDCYELTKMLTFTETINSVRQLHHVR